MISLRLFRQVQLTRKSPLEVVPATFAQTKCTAWIAVVLGNMHTVYLLTVGPVGEFKTRCDYDSIEPDELSFKKEQRVEVLEARLDGWWKVK